MSSERRLREDYGELTGQGVAALDRAAVDSGVSVVQLMEVAGWQIARWIFQRRPVGDLPLLIVAGHGNNGGDGLVAARHLSTWGCRVRVLVICAPEHVGGITGDQVRAARGAGLEVSFSPDGDIGAGEIDTAAIVIDALLGTGSRGDPRESQARVIRRLPPDRTLAVDLPSGLDAGTGVAGNPTVTAIATCTLTAMKAGLWTSAGRAHAGAVTVADIGMPAAAWQACGLSPPRLVRGGELLLVPTATN